MKINMDFFEIPSIRITENIENKTNNGKNPRKIEKIDKIMVKQIVVNHGEFSGTYSTYELPPRVILTFSRAALYSYYIAVLRTSERIRTFSNFTTFE